MKYFIIPLLLFSFNWSYSQQIKLTPEQDAQVEQLNNTALQFSTSGLNKKAASNYFKIALIYWENQNHAQSSLFFSKSEEEFKKANDDLSLIKVYNNHGMLHSEIGEIGKAIRYFSMILDLNKKREDKKVIATSHIDLAALYEMNNDAENALSHVNKALEIAQGVKDRDLVQICYNNLSQIYENAGDRQSAEYYRAQSKDVDFLVKNEELKETQQQKEKEVKQAIAEKQKTEERLHETEKNLSVAKDKLEKEIKSAEVALEAIEDTIAKKQKMIEELNLTQKLKDVQIEKQQLQIQTERYKLNIGIVVIVFVIIVAFLFWKAYRDKNKINKELEVKNGQISRQKADIEEQHVEIEKAFKKIKSQNLNITQSISYAYRIQDAMMPDLDTLKELLPESFIFLKPRDVVSGDFYWYRILKSDAGKPAEILLAAVDCTGHGVPGALMSMIGNNNLNSIVDRGITRPDLVLNELHIAVRNALNQEQTQNNDGMDIALCKIKLAEKEIEFAGAQNPLVVATVDMAERVKGDKHPIGGHYYKKSEFKLQTVKVTEPTSFYIFSDGYADQIGGADNRKFMTKRFREYLHSIHKEPMPEQKYMLENTLIEWQSDKNQVDDILVIGFHINA